MALSETAKQLFDKYWQEFNSGQMDDEKKERFRQMLPEFEARDPEFVASKRLGIAEERASGVRGPASDPGEPNVGRQEALADMRERSAASTFGGEALMSVVPTAAGVAAGAGTGALSGSLFGPIGAVAGGIIGGFGGGIGGAKVQDIAIESALGDEQTWEEFQKLRGAGFEQNPYSAVGGAIVPSALAFQPTNPIRNMQQAAKALASPAATRNNAVIGQAVGDAIGAGVGSGMEIYADVSQDRDIDWKRAALAGAGNAIFSGPMRIARKTAGAPAENVLNDQQKVAVKNAEEAEAARAIAEAEAEETARLEAEAAPPTEDEVRAALPPDITPKRSYKAERKANVLPPNAAADQAQNVTLTDEFVLGPDDKWYVADAVPTFNRGRFSGQTRRPLREVTDPATLPEAIRAKETPNQQRDVLENATLLGEVPDRFTAIDAAGNETVLEGKKKFFETPDGNVFVESQRVAKRPGKPMLETAGRQTFAKEEAYRLLGKRAEGTPEPTQPVAKTPVIGEVKGPKLRTVDPRTGKQKTTDTKLVRQEDGVYQKYFEGGEQRFDKLSDAEVATLIQENPKAAKNLKLIEEVPKTPSGPKLKTTSTGAQVPGGPARRGIVRLKTTPTGPQVPGGSAAAATPGAPAEIGKVMIAAKKGQTAAGYSVRQTMSDDGSTVSFSIVNRKGDVREVLSAATDDPDVNVKLEDALRKVGDLTSGTIRGKEVATSTVPFDPTGKKPTIPPSSSTETTAETGTTTSQLGEGEAPPPTVEAKPVDLDVLARAEKRRPDIPVSGEGERTSIQVKGINKNNAVTGRYALVDLDDLVPSHDPRNGFQPVSTRRTENTRDYTLPHNQDPVREGAAALNPDTLLLKGTYAEGGPPIVSADGEILGANGRHQMLLLARQAHPEQWKKYQARLKERAADFGIDPNAITEGKTVAFIADPMSAADEIRAIAVLNTDPQKAAVLSERGDALRRSLKVDHVDGLDIRDDETLNKALQREGPKIVERMIADGTIASGQIVNFIDPNTGKMTNDGLKVLEEALKNVAYGSAKTRTDLTASTGSLFDKMVPAFLRINLDEASNPDMQALGVSKAMMEGAAAFNSPAFETQPLSPLAEAFRSFFVAASTRPSKAGPVGRKLAASMLNETSNDIFVQHEKPLEERLIGALEDVRKTLLSDEKFSASERPKTAGKLASESTIEPRSARLKEAVALGNRLGMTVRVFDNPQVEHNAIYMTDPDGQRVVYLNARAIPEDVAGGGEHPLLSVVSHESLHDIRSADPEAYGKLLDWMKGNHPEFDNLSAKYREDYVRAMGEERVSDDVLNEEVMGKIFEANAQNTGFWTNLADSDAGLFRRVADFFRRIIYSVRRNTVNGQILKALKAAEKRAQAGRKADSRAGMSNKPSTKEEHQARLKSIFGEKLAAAHKENAKRNLKKGASSNPIPDMSAYREWAAEAAKELIEYAKFAYREGVDSAYDKYKSLVTSTGFEVSGPDVKRRLSPELKASHYEWDLNPPKFQGAGIAMAKGAGLLDNVLESARLDSSLLMDLSDQASHIRDEGVVDSSISNSIFQEAAQATKGGIDINRDVDAARKVLEQAFYKEINSLKKSAVTAVYKLGGIDAVPEGKEYDAILTAWENGDERVTDSQAEAAQALMSLGDRDPFNDYARQGVTDGQTIKVPLRHVLSGEGYTKVMSHEDIVINKKRMNGLSDILPLGTVQTAKQRAEFEAKYPGVHLPKDVAPLREHADEVNSKIVAEMEMLGIPVVNDILSTPKWEPRRKMQGDGTGAGEKFSVKQPRSSDPKIADDIEVVMGKPSKGGWRWWEAFKGDVNEFGVSAALSRQIADSQAPRRDAEIKMGKFDTVGDSSYKLDQMANDYASPVRQAYSGRSDKPGAGGGQIRLSDEGLPEFVPGTKGRDQIMEVAEKDGAKDEVYLYRAAKRAEEDIKKGNLGSVAETAFKTQDRLDRALALGSKKLSDGTTISGVAKEMNTWFRAALDMAQKAGLIDPELRKLWERENYVPFLRQVLMENGGDFSAAMKSIRSKSSVDLKNAIKKAEGGTGKIAPEEAEMALYSTLVATSMRNKAGQKFVDNFVNYPDASGEMVLREATPDEAKLYHKSLADRQANQLISVRYDGKEKIYKVSNDPWYTMIADTGGLIGSNDILEIANKVRQATQALTTNMPAFAGKNFLRDTAQAAIIAREDLGLVGSLKTIPEALKAYKDIVAGDAPDYAEFIGAGGYQGSRYGSRDSHETMQAQHARRTSDVPVIRSFQQLADFYGKLLEGGENANRLASYRRSRKAGETKGESAWRAKEMANYGTAGINPVVKGFAKTVPFLNARIVGLLKQARMLSAAEKGQKRGPLPGVLASKYLQNAAGLGIMSAALAAYNWANFKEEYHKLEEWERDFFWTTFFRTPDGKVQTIRFPKPFEAGAIGTVGERVANYFLDSSTDKGDAELLAKRVGHMLTQTFEMPNPLNPITWVQNVPLIGAAIQQESNRIPFLDKQIVPTDELDLPPSQQYGAETSRAMRAVARVAEPVVDISPRRAESFVRSLFGAAGNEAIKAADLTLRMFEGSYEKGDPAAKPPGAAPSMKLTQDIPFVSSLVSTITKGEADGQSSRDVSRYYDKMGETRNAKKELSHLRETRQPISKEKMKELFSEISSGRSLDASNSMVSKINANIRRFADDPFMSPDEKRKRIDELRRQRTKMIEAVMEAQRRQRQQK